MEYFNALFRLARTSCTPADLILAIGILAAAAISSVVLFWGTTEAAIVEVVVDGRVIGVYHPSADRHVTVSGARGEVKIDIRDGSVAVTSADCPQQICRRMGRIRRAGAMIVCVPNHLLIHLRGTQDANAPLITY